MTQSKIIGITGGVGCGKSAVMEILKEDYDAGILFTDLIAHELMAPGQVCYEGIVKTFGPGILAEDKTINRRRLSDIVFRDADLLKKLNELTHPAVIEETFSRTDKMKEAGKKLIAVESALLVDAGITDRFDSLWYVFAEDEIRIRRLMESRGYSEEKTRSVMGSQNKEAGYVRFCDHVIDNSRTLEETKRQIRDILTAMGVL